MKFAHPLLLAVLLPLVALAAWRLLRVGRRAGIRFSAVCRLPARTSGWRAYATLVSPFVLLAGLVLLAVAAARPQTPLDGESADRKGSRNVEAISIVMVVDVSGSMEILDLAHPATLAKVRNWYRERRRFFPGSRSDEAALDALNAETRLAQVRKLFAEFVAKRPDDFIGLVTFGTYADTRCPLTTDHRSLNAALEAVDIPRGEGEAMTAIGDGLGMALARLEKATTESKVIILLSDGVHNVRTSAAPKEMADIARNRGVKIYTIGVGTRAHFMPVVGETRTGVRLITDADAIFDESELKGLAEITNGRYWGVNDRHGLADALAEIDSLEKTEISEETVERIVWKELGFGFLWCGLALTLGAVTLSLVASHRMA